MYNLELFSLHISYELFCVLLSHKMSQEYTEDDGCHVTEYKNVPGILILFTL